MRHRLGAMITAIVHTGDLAQLAHRKLGIDTGPYLTSKGIASLELRDVLDLITVVYRYISENVSLYSHKVMLDKFVDEVNSIFIEENVGYYSDKSAGIHFLCDEEFSRTRVATVRGLGSSRFSAALHEFEKSFSFLDNNPPDTKAAVRASFESVEILFKLLSNDSKCQRLGVDEISKFLKPKAEKVYGKDPIAKQSTSLLIKSMTDWVSAVHFYRHGQAVEEPSPPPIEICIVIISQAATYLRWMIEIEEKINSSSSSLSQSAV